MFFGPFFINFFFLSGTSLLWMMGESAGEGMWLLALVTDGRSRDMSYGKCDMWLVTCDIYFFFWLKVPKSAEKFTKRAKNATKKKYKKFPKVHKCVKKAGFHSIDADIRSRRERWCPELLLYLKRLFKKIILQMRLERVLYLTLCLT